MGGIFHADTSYCVHGHPLVVVLIAEVDNLDLGFVDPKRQPPVLGDKNRCVSSHALRPTAARDADFPAAPVDKNLIFRLTGPVE
jgi:hypothetical protein